VLKRAVAVFLLLLGCSSGGTSPVDPDGPLVVDGPIADLLVDGGPRPDLPLGRDGSIQPGDNNRLLLRGTVVTPDEVIPQGEVLTNGDRLVCVAADCSAEPDAVGATIIDTAGVIYPGLIDAHNHINYNYQPVWQNPRLYGNHNQWQASTAYEQVVSGPHRDLTDSSGANMLCEAMKYGEIRSLVAGTTTVQGSVLRRCLKTLVRNADLPYHGLGGDPIRTNLLGVDEIDDPQALIDDFNGGDTTAYMLHLAEGIDETARSEFDDLEAMGLLLPQVKIIHGTALGRAELEKVKQAGMSIIWSPSSNLALYGETNDMVTAVNLGIPVALSPDWTPSGEPNVLD
jgi:cytosine/adenosine deaminase-related metal-dependent hydrolase